jgi:hypothetical protein
MVPLCDSGQTVLVRIVKLYRKRNNPQSHCVLHENLVCSPTWKWGFAKEVWLYVTSVMSASSLLKELWMEAALKPPSLDRISDDLEPSSVEAASLIFTHTAWYRFIQFWIFCCKLYAQKACWCPWPLQQILDNKTLGREEETTMWLTLQFTEHPNLQEGNKHQLSQLLIFTARLERGQKPLQSACYKSEITRTQKFPWYTSLLLLSYLYHHKSFSQEEIIIVSKHYEW